MQTIASMLCDRLEPLLQAMGYELMGCEIQGQNKQVILRIYVDSEGGITLADCSKISRQVSALLDVEDPIPGHYALEVSSPGIDRPLFKLDHYQKQIGKRIRVRVSVPIHTRRNFVGVLLRVDASKVHLLVDAEEIVLPFSSIEKANVIADIR